MELLIQLYVVIAHYNAKNAKAQIILIVLNAMKITS